MICIASARIIPDDPGPYSFVDTAAPPLDLNQGEIVMKEAILYLTPSQIKAYEASQKQDQESMSQFSEEDIKKVEEEVRRQLAGQNIFAVEQNSNERPLLKYQSQPPPVIEEPAKETPVEYPPQYHQKWVPIPNQQEDQKYFIPPKGDHHPKLAESYTYIKFYTDHKVHETPKLQLFHPIPHEHQIDPELDKFLEVQTDPLHKKQYKLVPYEYKTLAVPPLEDVKEITKITSLLEKYNIDQNPEISEDVSGGRLPQFQPELSELKYAPQYEEHKHEAELQNYLINIEKDNAIAKAQAKLKRHPSLIRNDVSIKRRQPTPLRHVWKH